MTTEKIEIKTKTLPSTLTALVDATLGIEKIRVRSQVRQSHLALQGRCDEETDNLIAELQRLESYTDGRIAKLLMSHPAYPWFSRVKGIGKENVAKVIGPVDIQRANTISALWKFAGFAVEGGHSPKRVKGEKLSYNSQLRSMCWRVAVSLMRAGGVFYEYYTHEKEKYHQKYANQEIKIIPTPAGKWMCENCGESWKNKRDVSVCCNNQFIIQKLKEEPAGIIYEGHLHNQALRKMIKLFLACLWLVWREAEGLPVTKPYAIEQLKHDSFINPWDMVDK